MTYTQNIPEQGLKQNELSGPVVSAADCGSVFPGDGAFACRAFKCIGYAAAEPTLAGSGCQRPLYTSQHGSIVGSFHPLSKGHMSQETTLWLWKTLGIAVMSSKRWMWPWWCPGNSARVEQPFCGEG